MLWRFWTEASRQQRAAFLAAWLGWILDAFDFTLFFLVMPEVGRELKLGLPALGGVVTATLLGRVLGGPLGGWLCDRFGRRRPLMASLVLYALFDTLVAFAHTYEEILLLRFLFGVGMGAEWSAGTALAMEHWPARSRGIASGLLQGSWAIGYFAAALGYRVIVPRWGWRPLFYLAAAPALLALFVRARVRESPSWEQAAGTGERASLTELWRSPAGRTAALVGALVLGGGFFTYYSLATFYPTLIAARGLGPDVLARLVGLFNAGMLAGAMLCGALSERIGRRPAIALFAAATIPVSALYLLPSEPTLLHLGAFLGGLWGVGWTGATPSYLAEQFATRIRGVGVGTAYHLGALVGALSPRAVPALEQAGLALQTSMALCAAGGAAVVVVCVWLRPERRGAPL
ncbi:MAG: MFS transporter [Myxococcales bacterium]|nr:MFS transporter [Myxococcota bacterium]MDW8283976.1 MFS transporter [Myxococcales bacterium]